MHRMAEDVERGFLSRSPGAGVEDAQLSHLSVVIRTCRARGSRNVGAYTASGAETSWLVEQRGSRVTLGTDTAAVQKQDDSGYTEVGQDTRHYQRLIKLTFCDPTSQATNPMIQISGREDLQQIERSSVRTLSWYQHITALLMLFVLVFSVCVRFGAKSTYSAPTGSRLPYPVVILILYVAFIVGYFPGLVNGALLLGTIKPADIPHVNGYLKLTFDPPEVIVVREGETSGVVNVSLSDDSVAHNMPASVWVKPCCTDPKIATILGTGSSDLTVTQNGSSLLSLTVRGHALGRTSIRFLVLKNTSGPLTTDKETFKDEENSLRLPSSALLLSRRPGTTGKLPDDVIAWASNNTGSLWWLPFTYDVTVTNQQDPSHFYLSATVLGLMAFNMVVIGGQVDGNEIVYLLKKPMAVGLSLICRFGVIPAVGLGIIELLQPDRDASIGALALLCSPAEGASNLLVLLAEADLTLSVTVTCVTNFAAIGMLPLWTILFETRIYNQPGNVEIPFRDAFILFSYIVLAIVIGYIFHRKFPTAYHHIWTYLPTITILTLVLAVIVEIYNANHIFAIVTKEIFCACVMLSSCGYIFGAMVAFIARQPQQTMLVLCLEAGTRTTYMTGVLLTLSLPQPEADMAKAAPVLCTLLSLTPSLILVSVLRIYRRYTGHEYTDAEYGQQSSSSEDEERDEEEGEDGPREVLPSKEVVGEKETCI